MKVNLETGSLGIRLPEPAAMPGKAGETNETQKAGFADAFGRAFSKVEDSARAADQAGDDLLVGKIDLHEAMVSMEKADLMLKLGTTVRNKLLEAYQQLMSSANG